MKRIQRILSVLVGIAFVPAAAWAANPHFINQDAGIENDGDLSCSFKIAGLGDNVTITVTCSANASAFYACFNRGGKHPQASNKEESAGPVSGSGDFTSGQNGQVTGELEVNAPAATISCPGGQVLRLCSVSYTNIQLTIGDGPSASVPGSQGRTFINCV
jgi:hypothetical protein